MVKTEDYEFLNKFPKWLILVVIFLLLILSLKESIFTHSLEEFIKSINITWLITAIAVLGVFYYRGDISNINFNFADEKTFFTSDIVKKDKDVSFKLNIPFEVSNLNKREGFIYAMMAEPTIKTYDEVLKFVGMFGLGPTEIFISNIQVPSSISEKPIKITKNVRKGKISVNFSFGDISNDHLGFIMIKLVQELNLNISCSLSSGKKITTFKKKLKIKTREAWFTK